MIFQHTWQAVLEGRKTHTRRLVKPGDVELVKPLPTDQVFFQHDKMYLYHRADETREITSIEHYGRTKWQVGRTYAVQPGRGKKQVGRIRITGIRQEHVQDISEEDAMAEGIPYPVKVHSTGTLADEIELDFSIGSRRYEYAALWDTIHTKPGTTWESNPLVWVLEFELVSNTGILIRGIE